MSPALESRLWTAIKAGASPRDFIDFLLHEGDLTSSKPAHATLEKWSRQGCYNYGVALDLGWADHSGKVPKPRCDTPAPTELPQ